MYVYYVCTFENFYNVYARVLNKENCDGMALEEHFLKEYTI